MTPGTTPAPPTGLADEIERQFDVLWHERRERIGLTTLAIALTTIYVPVWIAVLCALIDAVAEVVSMHLMRGLDPARQPGRYRLTLACVFVMEFSFAGAAGLVWMVDDPFSKAFGLGMVMVTLLHLTTVRSIHMPYGLAGIAAVALAMLSANAYFWLGMGDLVGLTLSSMCAVGGLAYSATAMRSSNKLHRAMAERSVTAHAAVAAKDRLLATISHELRTPLNGILGMGHAELARATSPEARARLGVLVASAEGLSVILDDILDISAARDGRLAIRPEVCVPADEVAATVQLFRHGAGERAAPFTVEIDPELSRPARFDRQRFRQCLSNLISNALRHGQSANVRVRARRTIGPRGTALLDLTVADDGPGVPEALRGILFEPFARLNGEAPEGGRQGQGLGLSISRSLARLMGGDLVLVPPPPAEEGAMFRLTLELGPAPGPASVAPRHPVPVQAATRPGPRVLVVDDIATNRLVALSCLQLAGAEGIAVDSGALALEETATGRFDAVLLDMNMPGLNGLATLARIRALPGPAARVKVIAMTADTGDDKSTHYLAAGCDGYLAKPVTPERIADVLASTLAGRPQAGARNDIAAG